MPNFYFHTEDGRPFRDREGVELPDLDAARREAVLAFSEILKAQAATFWSEGLLRMSVCDEAGMTLFLLEVTATTAPAVS